MKHRFERGSRVVLGVSSVALAALALTACGSSSAKSTSTRSDSGSTVLGVAKKGTGTPVKVGFAFDGLTSTIDTSDQEKGADAAVAYANAHLGGIGGHPVDVFKCETKADPATDCGNQFVAAKVIVVDGGGLGATEPVIKPLNAPGVQIPYVDVLNITQAALASPIDFSMSNPLVPFGGPAVIAKKDGIKRAAIIMIDVPSVVGPAKQLGTLLFGNAGTAVDLVPVAPGTADLTPQIQAEQAKKPGMYHVIGNPAFCAAALKAMKTLGVKAVITGVDRCLDKTSAASVPGGFKGMTVFTPADLTPGNDETKLFDAVRKSYANDHVASPEFVRGYQAMLGLIRVLNAADLSDFTPAGVVRAMRSAPPTPLPMGGGTMVECNGKKIFISPAICTVDGLSADAQADGSMANFTLLSDPSIYAPPSKK